MKLINYYKGSRVRLGVATGHGVIDVERAAQQLDLGLPTTMEDVFAQGGDAIAVLSVLLKKELPEIPLEEIRFAPVVTAPEKIICIGLNYRDHAEESGMELPAFPVVFSKFSNALAAHSQPIPIPDGVRQCDYEAELVVVMGKEAKNVPEEQALDYVAGYTVGNDLSARDLQFLSSQWILGKTCDGFAPVGPCLTTADEVDPGNLDISCSVNGHLRQHSNTSNLIFSVPTLISTLSRSLPLRPGDLIFTGTPGGVILGYSPEEQVWLKPGDRVSVTIQGLGTLENTLA